MLTVLNTTDLMGPEWRFLQNKMPSPPAQWCTYTSTTQTGSARMKRLRACFGAAAQAQGALKQGNRPVFVSHLPNMAAITNIARRIRVPSVPQVAFAFNFTTLPQGLRRTVFRHALRGIDEFVVFSRYEQELYADWFDIPVEKFHFMRWAMDAPKVAPPVAEGASEYICSIGGEARDYGLLAAAMRHLPNRRAVIVARPYSVAGIDFPDNVDVRINLPGPETWRLATASVGMALPLHSQEAACGHITFAAAQLLGIPLVVTDTLGLADYISDDMVYQKTRAGDIAAMVQAIEGLFTQQDMAQRAAQQTKIQAEQNYALSNWTSYFEDVFERLC